MPLDWTEEHYKSKLRGFFLDMDWIKPEDNESKLIMIPFIRAIVEYFQDILHQKQRLSRERTSVLFSVQPANEDDEQTPNENGLVKFSYTFFKMQSAPEMIAVSKTLASSDFWLVPSVVQSESIQLENLRNVIYNAVRNILARIRGEGSTWGLECNAAKKDDPAWVIACELGDSFVVRKDATISVGAMQGIDFEKHQLQDLKSWSRRQLIVTIFKEANVKQYFEQVCNFYKKATNTHDVARDAPDGIQHILLYNSYLFRILGDFSNQDFGDWIIDALIEENIIQPGNEFLDALPFSAEGAFQQPYKIMQIASAILPPVVVNDEDQNKPTVPAHEHKDSLITPNSFYVQANVAETQIDFILNKEVSSSANAAELFTVQERSIAVEDVVTSITHLLWNHYQSMLDLQEQQHCLFKRCQDHETMPLLSSNYVEFKRNAEKVIDCWFATNDAFPRERLDSYSLILVDQQCNCALKLSQRLLLEVGLKPAVGNLATTITSALFSNDFFGRYQLSTLIVVTSLKAIKNTSFSCAIDRLLKQALEGFLQVHHNRLLLLFQGKHVDNNVLRYLGRGDYSQVSSMTITFKLKVLPENTSVVAGMLEDGVCKRVLMTPDKGNRYYPRTVIYTYTGLTKGEQLPLAGLHFTFLVKGCVDVDIEVFASDHSEGSIHQHQLGFMRLPEGITIAQFSLFSIRVLPEHYSSTLKFAASVSCSNTFEKHRRIRNQIEKENLISVTERLNLKKQLYNI
ncbi:hypothetical protein FB192DRAFT_1395956 [Mucor lusitanicus]|uniref:Uncharacterized protein n=1 Tax=Mucor circinelloides f. lusitanicus TaxID=29924 RepID=A0A8H4BA62_MUCCL|nr:hypothetical protein FB192DRAFT_1395956 [Mucor lusitanicus]